MDAPAEKVTPSSDSEHSILGYLDILLPSGMSAVVCIVLSVLTLVAHNYHSIQRYFDVSTNWQIKKAVDTFLRSLLGVQRTNLLVSALFWALIGIIVYIFVQGIVGVAIELGQDLEERRYIRPEGSDQNKSLKHTFRRAIFRTIVAIVILVYVNRVLGYFLRVQPGSIVYLGSAQTTSYTLKLFVGEVLALHGLVVLLRLFLLKRRLVTTT